MKAKALRALRLCMFRIGFGLIAKVAYSNSGMRPANHGVAVADHVLDSSCLHARALSRSNFDP